MDHKSLVALADNRKTPHKENVCQSTTCEIMKAALSIFLHNYLMEPQNRLLDWMSSEEDTLCSRKWRRPGIISVVPIL